MTDPSTPGTLSPPETLLAVDPGRAKCGLAVVTGPAQEGQAPRCLERAVVAAERLTLAVADILRRRPDIGRILIGGGTNSATLRRALEAAFPQLPLQTVDEHNTSARARQRFRPRRIPPPDGVACCRPASVPRKSLTTITPQLCLRRIILRKKRGHNAKS